VGSEQEREWRGVSRPFTAGKNVAPPARDVLVTRYQTHRFHQTEAGMVNEGTLARTKFDESIYGPFIWTG
jgi:hypothetical protein